MKLKVRDLVASQNALQELLAPTSKLKIVPSFWLSRQARKVAFVVEDYETHRVKLVRAYGEEVSPGRYEVKPGTENMPKYQEEVEQLLDQELELDIEQRPATSAYLGEAGDSISGQTFWETWYLWEDGTSGPPAPSARGETRG